MTRRGLMKHALSASFVGIGIATIAMCGAVAPVAAAVPAITSQIDLDQQSEAISPYEYGMFIEPIGGLVARSLWAEMLDDRKFYFPVVDATHDPKLPASAEGRPAMALRKWRPIGDAGA